jgi:hypothetical protein
MKSRDSKDPNQKKRRALRKRSRLPLCHSAFLQDVTIALGRRSLKSLRYSNPVLKFEVKNEDADDRTIERMNIEAQARLDVLVKLSIWDDGIAWIYIRQKQSKTPAFRKFEAHANLAGMGPDEVAELIRTTLKNPFAMEGTWTNLNH